MTNQPTAAAWDVAAMTACATGLRPDWDPQDTTGALIAAQHRGWTPTHALIVLARLLADPDSTPRDLLAAARPAARSWLAPRCGISWPLRLARRSPRRVQAGQRDHAADRDQQA